MCGGGNSLESMLSWEFQNKHCTNYRRNFSLAFTKMIVRVIYVNYSFIILRSEAVLAALEDKI